MTSNRMVATGTTLLLGLLLAAPVFAGETLLGAPSYDHASETTYRQVSWADFLGNGKAPPGWNRWQNGSYAHIATNIKIGHFEIATQKNEGGWIARPVGIRPYAIMAKDFSAVLPGSRDDFTLGHEQLHFDIAELMARRLTARLDAVRGEADSERGARADLEERIREVFQEGLRELDEIQARYDADAGRTLRKRPQKRWEKNVATMFAEATRELEKILAAREANGS